MVGRAAADSGDRAATIGLLTAAVTVVPVPSPLHGAEEGTGIMVGGMIGGPPGTLLKATAATTTETTVATSVPPTKIQNDGVVAMVPQTMTLTNPPHLTMMGEVRLGLVLSIL